MSRPATASCPIVALYVRVSTGYQVDKDSHMVIFEIVIHQGEVNQIAADSVYLVYDHMGHLACTDFLHHPFIGRDNSTLDKLNYSISPHILKGLIFYALF